MDEYMNHIRFDDNMLNDINKEMRKEIGGHYSSRFPKVPLKYGQYKFEIRTLDGEFISYNGSTLYFTYNMKWLRSDSNLTSKGWKSAAEKENRIIQLMLMYGKKIADRSNTYFLTIPDHPRRYETESLKNLYLSEGFITPETYSKEYPFFAKEFGGSKSLIYSSKGESIFRAYPYIRALVLFMKILVRNNKGTKYKIIKSDETFSVSYYHRGREGQIDLAVDESGFKVVEPTISASEKINEDTLLFPLFQSFLDAKYQSTRLEKIINPGNKNFVDRLVKSAVPASIAEKMFDVLLETYDGEEIEERISEEKIEQHNSRHFNEICILRLMNHHFVFEYHYSTTFFDHFPDKEKAAQRFVDLVTKKSDEYARKELSHFLTGRY